MFLKAIDMADGQVLHPQVVYNKRMGRYRDTGTYCENEDMAFSGCAWNMHP